VTGDGAPLGSVRVLQKSKPQHVCEAETHEKLGREIAKLWGPEWTEEADGERLINPADAIVRGTVDPRCLTAFQLWRDNIAIMKSGGQVDVSGDPRPKEHEPLA
jgi:hypothetical protein